MAVRTAPWAPVPDPLPVPCFDAHTHLDMLTEPVAEVLAQASQTGVTRVVTVGTDISSSRWAAACAGEYESVYAAVAIHPNDTALARDGLDSESRPTGLAGRDVVLAEIARLAALPKVRAVGETGLDYYRDSAPPSLQREWFAAHIEIAKATGRALMIHDREAHDDVLAILEAEGPPSQVIFHCFSGGAELARRCADAGYVMSFAGNVTFSSAATLREAVAAAPAELILAETDAPFLTPAPNRGKQNAPAQVALTLRAIAEVKKMDVAKLCAVIADTGQRVFGWPGEDRPAGTRVPAGQAPGQAADRER